MVRELWEKTRGLYQAGKLAEAERACRELLDKAPSHAQAWFHLGLIAYRTGRHEDAVAAMRRVIHIQPKFTEAHNNLGSSLARLGKLDEAAASFQEALRLAPDYPEAINNLANIHRDQGRLDEAVAGYEKAIGLRAGYTEAHNNLGIVYARKGSIEKAVACYRRALELRPQYAEAANNLGIALARQKKLDEAAAQFERALEIKPDYADALANLATVLAEQGNQQQAEVCYRQALELQAQALPDSQQPGKSLFRAGAAGRGDRLLPAGGAGLRRSTPRPTPTWERSFLSGAKRRRPARLFGNRGGFAQPMPRPIPVWPRPWSKSGSSAKPLSTLAMPCGFGPIWPRPTTAGRRPPCSWEISSCAACPSTSGDRSGGARPLRDLAKPLWQGEPLKGGTVLLSVGPSVRDAFQFIRYARWVQDRGGRVIAAVVLGHSSRSSKAALPPKEFCGEDEPPGDFDVQIPLASLPRVFGTVLGTISVELALPGGRSCACGLVEGPVGRHSRVQGGDRLAGQCPLSGRKPRLDSAGTLRSLGRHPGGATGRSTKGNGAGTGGRGAVLDRGTSAASLDEVHGAFGGRQGLKEAQTFPADYDGIIAGAPANYWTHLVTRIVGGAIRAQRRRERPVHG